MKFERPSAMYLLPIALALLALILFLVAPALTGSETTGRRLPVRAATHG